VLQLVSSVRPAARSEEPKRELLVIGSLKSSQCAPRPVFLRVHVHVGMSLANNISARKFSRRGVGGPAQRLQAGVRQRERVAGAGAGAAACRWPGPGPPANANADMRQVAEVTRVFAPVRSEQVTAAIEGRPIQPAEVAPSRLGLGPAWLDRGPVAGLQRSPSWVLGRGSQREGCPVAAGLSPCWALGFWAEGAQHPCRSNGAKKKEVTPKTQKKGYQRRASQAPAADCAATKTARPSGAGRTQRPWPTAGCEPLLLTSA
jgi:hypothetical protein